jgi:hypothetical protein
MTIRLFGALLCGAVLILATQSLAHRAEAQSGGGMVGGGYLGGPSSTGAPGTGSLAVPKGQKGAAKTDRVGGGGGKAGVVARYQSANPTPQGQMFQGLVGIRNGSSRTRGTGRK